MVVAPTTYRNRYVRSDGVVEALGGRATPGPRHGMGDNTANTNVIAHAGSTCAIVEAGGLPVQLTDELETVARSDFDGTLPGSFTAHPKRDPQTGELHAVVYYWEWDYIQYVVVGVDGRVRKSVNVPVPGGPMVHDCGLTESRVVLFDLPCTFDLELAMHGASLPYRWNPEYGARVGLLPREGEADDDRVVRARRPLLRVPPAQRVRRRRPCGHRRRGASRRCSTGTSSARTRDRPVFERWTIDPAGRPRRPRRDLGATPGVPARRRARRRSQAPLRLHRDVRAGRHQRAAAREPAQARPAWRAP